MLTMLAMDLPVLKTICVQLAHTMLVDTESVELACHVCAVAHVKPALVACIQLLISLEKFLVVR